MSFQARHIGPSESEIEPMLSYLGFSSLAELADKIVPQNIRLDQKIFEKLAARHPAQSEFEALEKLAKIASKNKVFKSYIGLGYYGCITPAVIQRNILENPLWYTQYTPYQAEIAQGRLEALLNYQTMVAELCALPVANASLLDEATAAAEAMNVCLARAQQTARTFFVAHNCNPQSIAVIRTRANLLGVKLIVGDPFTFSFSAEVFGALLQYPACDGSLPDYEKFIQAAHDNGSLVAMASDLLALTLLKAPGEMGADIALGSSQRFGVPLGFGGPHAAFFAVKDELKRLMPGRLIGVSKDSAGKAALRLALQTREQHIRREKATSNVCTAQVLLAVMSSMYAVYHGPSGLRAIAVRVHKLARCLAQFLATEGMEINNKNFFDTLSIRLPKDKAQQILSRAEKRKINLGLVAESDAGAKDDTQVLRVALDESSSDADLLALFEIFSGRKLSQLDAKMRPKKTGELACAEDDTAADFSIAQSQLRTSAYLKQSVFNQYHSETEFLRYVNRLQSRDLSLAVSMIPLGSCTMKLNASSEMLALSWPQFAAIHPFAPKKQTAGYLELFKQLQEWLKDVTGFAAVSFQPNSGAAGEYAGLSVIRAYQRDMGQGQRDVCLIPHSAHGTNPASAAMAGLTVVEVDCDANGNIDIADLRTKVSQYSAQLCALMITYPSTHGVFEESVKEVCAIVHQAGAQVYMDGANLNALVGLCRPADIGADLCHINLHKTFAIPHGGGGPGAGPIAVSKHLAEYLPGHALRDLGYKKASGEVSAAPWGSALICTIPWVYMQCMGFAGLRRASQVALLNANYIAKRLEPDYPVLYRGTSSFVAHECILDLRQLEKSSAVKVEDVAKRLMDYGFHAPTVSWPVAGTVMVEPTESESKAELDRFCEAMISIRQEIRAVEQGRQSREDNLLKNAPHTTLAIAATQWNHPYSREEAAFPAPWLKEYKFWPAVGRVDNVYGDRNLVCLCS